MYEEPPIVDLDEILDEEEAAEHSVTPTQWLLVIGGGIVGVAGLLGVLVTVSPALIEIVRWVNMISAMINGG